MSLDVQKAISLLNLMWPNGLVPSDYATAIRGVAYFNGGIAGQAQTPAPEPTPPPRRSKQTKQAKQTKPMERRASPAKALKRDGDRSKALVRKLLEDGRPRGVSTLATQARLTEFAVRGAIRRLKADGLQIQSEDLPRQGPRAWHKARVVEQFWIGERRGRSAKQTVKKHLLELLKTGPSTLEDLGAAVSKRPGAVGATLNHLKAAGQVAVEYFYEPAADGLKTTRRARYSLIGGGA